MGRGVSSSSSNDGGKVIERTNRGEGMGVLGTKHTTCGCQQKGHRLEASYSERLQTAPAQIAASISEIMIEYPCVSKESLQRRSGARKVKRQSSNYFGPRVCRPTGLRFDNPGRGRKFHENEKSRGTSPKDSKLPRRHLLGRWQRPTPKRSATFG